MSMHENITILVTDSNSPNMIADIIQTLILPIIVAILVYILVDRLGEWKRRKMYSRLGVAIIDSLLEEMNTGIKVMKDALAAAEDPNETGPPYSRLPVNSWSGMTTIPDEVLLRILETSANFETTGLHPREIRSHSKNYFTHMAGNYETMLSQSIKLSKAGQDWQFPLRYLLVQSEEPYLETALIVKQMLEDSQALLKKNSKRRRPK